MNAIILGLLLFSADPAPACPIRATVESIHDADTMVLTIHLPFKVDLPKRSIRAVGYDAWEVSKVRQTVKITDAELVKGKLARDELGKLIASGALYVEEVPQSDPYGRTNARLWILKGNVTPTWIDVAQWMADNGHVRGER